MSKTENPFRDKQQDPPRFICLTCGQEQYAWDEEPETGYCIRCVCLGQKEEKEHDVTGDIGFVSGTGAASAESYARAGGKKAAGHRPRGTLSAAMPHWDAASAVAGDTGSGRAFRTIL